MFPANLYNPCLYKGAQKFGFIKSINVQLPHKITMIEDDKLVFIMIFESNDEIIEIAKKQISVNDLYKSEKYGFAFRTHEACTFSEIQKPLLAFSLNKSCSRSLPTIVGPKELHNYKLHDIDTNYTFQIEKPHIIWGPKRAVTAKSSGEYIYCIKRIRELAFQEFSNPELMDSFGDYLDIQLSVEFNTLIESVRNLPRTYSIIEESGNYGFCHEIERNETTTHFDAVGKAIKFLCRQGIDRAQSIY